MDIYSSFKTKSVLLFHILRTTVTPYGLNAHNLVNYDKISLFTIEQRIEPLLPLLSHSLSLCFSFSYRCKYAYLKVKLSNQSKIYFLNV